jgi:hypothetical protein
VLEARERVLHEAFAQAWAEDGVLDIYEVADWIRCTERKSKALRTFAITLANNDDRDEVLASAARLATLANAVESDVDEVAARARIGFRSEARRR